MPSRRYLLHTRASGGGGAERVFSMLAEGLAERGHDVTLAVDMVDPGTLAPAGVRLIELGRGHAGATAALARLVRRGRFDAAAGAVAVSDVKLAAARVLSLARTPIVLSYHGFEEYKTGRLSALGYHGMPALRRIASRIVCVSDGLSREMIERWGADPKRTVRIYNPVALPPYPPPARRNPAPPVVAALGRLSAEKGMAGLVAAFALVTTPDARLVIGGDGPERDRIEALILEKELSDRVTLLGTVDGPAPVFGAADLAVVPSRTEAFGMAVVEALGYGLPVVSTDCGGPREILGDGRWGRLVPAGDPAALAAAIDAALADPGDPAERRRRAEAFSRERGIDAWEELLEAVAGER